MKDSKKLMEMVFDEVYDIDVNATGGTSISSAVPKGMDICTWMAMMCAYNAVVPGCGGGTNIDACEWVQKNC